MDCQDVRAALSARLDGEPTSAPDDVVDAHLDACRECQSWYATVTALGRDLYIGVAGQQDEPQQSGEALADQLLATHAVPTGSFRSRQYPLLIARIVLVLLAVVNIGWAGTLLFGQVAGPVVENPEFARYVFDAATYRFALAVGLLCAGVRPAMASSMLPIYLALWAFGAGFATRNLVFGLAPEDSGANPLWGLALNLAAVVALVVCWLGRHHLFTPLSQSWKTATAQPLSFSNSDITGR
ncbi:hypothetical protein F7230_03095 [Corynebacterium sp. 320]|uniref:zf-HC2 domain-containing protein n=1 Tax=Corynebacterium TaxID=1716 RepID=UPI00125CB5CA|nr:MULTISPECIES: zf-HC2 domain-containing protein [Corynebacterium]KAB1504095.1 hypothetical protein F7230_03095 [Corynebacterium sp. 320]KAB3528231.1 hypothetical protein F8354_03095 [Corynebacterium sp. 250]QNP91770.1 zf-HC2 domain-containing protein [Corynebacterium zhongnanshanii]